MKKIPNTVQIGGYTFKIKRVETVDEEDSYGSHNYVEGVIELRKNLGDKEWSVLLHEVLHGIDDVYNADSLDEGTIDRMAQGLYQVLKSMKLI